MFAITARLYAQGAELLAGAIESIAGGALLRVADFVRFKAFRQPNQT